MAKMKNGGVCRDGWVVPSLSEIRKNLSSDLAWAERAIIVLHEKQTKDEQMVGMTTDHNGVGFNAFDAEILSSFAQQLSRSGYHLSLKQQNIAFKKLKKYARQIQEIIVQTHGGYID